MRASTQSEPVQAFAPHVPQSERVHSPTARDMVKDTISLPVQGMRHGKEAMQELYYGKSRPVCQECHRAWRWPRNLSHVNLDISTPKHIKPQTQSTVVAYVTAKVDSDPPQATIPEDVFRQIEYMYPGTTDAHKSWDCSCTSRLPHRLVKEFHYDRETGDVFYNHKDLDNEDDVVYARLVTLNSWYSQLFACLMRVGLMILDYYSTVLLLLSFVIENDSIGDNAVSSHHWFKYPFVIGWCTIFIIQLIWSMVSASQQWRLLSCWQKGDIINYGSKYDMGYTFAALVFFTFFSIEQSVRDVVIVLHPWKSVQPFGAFKANGARAYIIGYTSDDMFMIEEFKGQFFRMLTQQILSTLVFAAKVYICYIKPQPWLVVSCISSFLSIFLSWNVWLKLWGARRRMHAALLKMVKSLEDQLRVKDSESARRQHLAYQLMYKAHFGSLPFSRMRNRKNSFRTAMATAQVAPACDRSNTDDSQAAPSAKPKPLAKPVCKACGRDEPRQDFEENSHPRRHPKIKAGETWVQLSPKYRDYHDAKYGPLRPRNEEVSEHLKVGKVLQIRDVVEGVGARCQVAVLKPCATPDCPYQAKPDSTHCCSNCRHGVGHGERCRKRPQDIDKYGMKYWYDLGSLEPEGTSSGDGEELPTDSNVEIVDGVARTHSELLRSKTC